VFRASGDLDRGAEERHTARIRDVTVLIKCSKVVPQDQEIFPHNGTFIFTGTGVPEGCDILVQHPDYKRKAIRLERNHLRDQRYPLSQIYTLDIELEPVLRGGQNN
jgi:hypothetical protein